MVVDGKEITTSITDVNISSNQEDRRSLVEQSKKEVVTVSFGTLTKKSEFVIKAAIIYEVKQSGELFNFALPTFLAETMNSSSTLTATFNF